MLEEIYRIDRKAGAISILLTLDRGGELRFSQLGTHTKLDRATTVGAVDLLVDLGLVEVQASERFPFSKRLNLSPAGVTLIRSPLNEWPTIFFRLRGDAPGGLAEPGGNGLPIRSRTLPGPGKRGGPSLGRS